MRSCPLKKEQMTSPSRQAGILRTRNHLLSSLSQADFALLESRLESAELPLHAVLEEAHEPVTHIYFIEDGLASVVVSASADMKLEAGLIGCEGMSGLSVVMGNARSPHQTFMQIKGSGLKFPPLSCALP